jgi:putative spermidine/putrescine transport system permease protein
MTVGRVALRAAAGLALGFILLPLFLVSWLAFFRNEVVVFPPTGYTLRWFGAILDQRNFVDGFLTSLQVGVFAMLAGLTLGVPASLGLARYRFPGRESLGLLMPLVVPGVVAGTMGLIHQPLQLMYTEGAVIVGITAVNLPFMVLTLSSVIEGIDPALEEAALNLGARPLQVFRRVILPLAMPGVLAGTILVFILGMNAYATPILLGGPRFQMMGPVVYGQFAGQNNWPFGAALSFVLMAATLSLSAVSHVLVQRRYRR